jgi:HAD superfamily hydrolase (TIGR01549 family)
MLETTANFDGISTLAIDLVGTLICKPTPHFYGTASEFLSKPGAQVSVDQFRRTFRRRYWEHSMGNYETDHEFYSALLADLSRTYDPSLEVLTDIYVRASTAFPEVSQFLESMSQKYRLVLASNYVEQWAARILESNGWLPYFSGCLLSSSCRFRKPSRQFFRDLLKIANASPSQVLMIGDSLVNDVYGARVAGLRSVLLDREETIREPTDRDFTWFSSLHELARNLVSERTVSLHS